MRCNDTCLTNKSMILGILLVNTAGTMSYEPPTPPAELPTDIVNTLNGYSPDQLQDVARYAEALAEHKARRPASKKSRMTTDRGAAGRSPRRCSGEGHNYDQGDQRQPVLLLAVAGR